MRTRNQTCTCLPQFRTTAFGKMLNLLSSTSHMGLIGNPTPLILSLWGWNLNSKPPIHHCLALAQGTCKQIRWYFCNFMAMAMMSNHTCEQGPPGEAQIHEAGVASFPMGDVCISGQPPHIIKFWCCWPCNSVLDIGNWWAT